MTKSVARACVRSVARDELLASAFDAATLFATPSVVEKQEEELLFEKGENSASDPRLETRDERDSRCIRARAVSASAALVHAPTTLFASSGSGFAARNADAANAACAPSARSRARFAARAKRASRASPLSPRSTSRTAFA